MNTNTETTPAKPLPPLGSIRPSLSFYHANAKGTGSAVQMRLHPAHDYTDGSIWLKIANQMTIGNRMGPNPTFATFDWENAMTVKLDFSDLCQMLQVLRGECEAINDGKGLYHRSPLGLTTIRLKHLVDPVSGYVLEICRSSQKGNAADGHAAMLFNPAEALGLCESIAGAMYLVSFGIPMLVPHDTSAYRAQVKEARDAAA